MGVQVVQDDVNLAALGDRRRTRFIEMQEFDAPAGRRVMAGF